MAAPPTTISVVAKKKHKKRAWNLFFLVLPFMLVVLLLNYVPLFGWALSLVEYKPGYPLLENEFVGLKYFEILLGSRDIVRVMKNTLIFSAVNFCILPLPMFFAIFLNEIGSPRFRKAAQTVTTLPHFISWVIVYSLAFAIFSTEGMVNEVLGMLGMRPQMVLNEADSVYWFQTLVGMWKGIGWSAIIYIAAIAGIDQEQYEAATVDGAGKFQSIIHITIPGLMPTFVVLMLLNISNFVNQGLEQYYVFRNPIIYNNIETLELFVYRNGIQLGDYSYATAVGILKTVVSLMLLFVSNAVAKKVRGESIV